jgi:hypothetical protein
MGDLDQEQQLARVLAQRRILARDGEIRLRIGPVVVGERQLRADSVASGDSGARFSG